MSVLQLNKCIIELLSLSAQWKHSFFLLSCPHIFFSRLHSLYGQGFELRSIYKKLFRKCSFDFEGELLKFVACNSFKKGK